MCSSIRRAAWKALGGGSCRIARAAKHPGMTLTYSAAASAAATVAPGRTRSEKPAVGGPIFRWADFWAIRQPRISSSGTRRFENRTDRFLQLKTRLTKGGQIVFRPIEIAKRRELWIGRAQFCNRDTHRVDAIK